jgi:predicted GTPase
LEQIHLGIGQVLTQLTQSPIMTDAGIAQMSNLKKEDIVIALMGVTGSGKSTLVSLLSDGPVRIGHELTSCKMIS